MRERIGGTLILRLMDRVYEVKEGTRMARSVDHDKNADARE